GAPSPGRASRPGASRATATIRAPRRLRTSEMRITPLGRRRRATIAVTPMAGAAEIVVKELTPALWPTVERLFGANGACGGCWCMYWRIAEGERYDDVKGPNAKRRFKALVARGDAHGLL